MELKQVSYSFYTFMYRANLSVVIARGVLGMSRDMNIELVRMIEEHGIHPVIARTFEWDEAKEALNMLLNQTVVGKIVIKV